MKKQHYKIGLIIGRFQPFHHGHAYLLKKALEYCDEIVIGIGSANKTDADNPWNVVMRKKMIEAFLEHENLADKVHTIVTLDDMTDEAWTKEVLQKAGNFDVVIGNNDWVNSLLGDAGKKVLTLPYFQRFLYEGQKIRKNMKEGKEWENRVPSYITPLLKGTIND
ncbi:MAG: adenylyltransferase/cytidyltransferase family protein [Candidatus Levybacteria bacterium]|nr:adenylyltransferase/cytidyltransferase family protein [Candidatus Levybacteria bacterium]